MTDQSNVFDDKQIPASTEDGAPAGDPSETKTPSVEDVFADRLASIKNPEGKPKYDSVEKALEGLANAQDYIPQLKGELSQKEEEIANLRKELERMGNIEEVVSRLTADKSKDDAPVDTPPQGVGLDDEQLEAKLAALLDKRTKASAAQANQDAVNKALNEKYGDKAAEVVKQKAAEYGFTPKQLGELAAQSPKAVLQLFGQSEGNNPKPTTPGRNMSLGQPPQPELEKPTKSLLLGATSKEQAEYMRKIKEDVYRRHGITE